MKRSFASVGVMILTSAHLAAADLGSELAAWGPLATDTERSIHDGLWFMHGAGIWTGGERMNGLLRTTRDDGLDGEVVVGWGRDGHNEGDSYFPTYQELRVFLRAGSDPLASHGGEPLLTVGGVASAAVLVSVQGQIGWSRDRGVVADGEMSIFPLRVRIEVDDDVQTVRIGSGPRLMGSTAPWAWGTLIDWAVTTVDGGRRDEGAIAEGYLFFRPWNHGLIGLEVSDFIHVGDEHDLIRTSFLLGATF